MNVGVFLFGGEKIVIWRREIFHKKMINIQCSTLNFQFGNEVQSTLR
jgi:hypothetical protein